MQCQYCNGTKFIQTAEGYRCRNTQCEGFNQTLQKGVECEDCGGAMEYRGLNSWGEPGYKCFECGSTAKL